MSKSAKRKFPCASKLFDFSVVVVGDRPNGGARRDRTDDLMLAKHALSQLSYGPVDRARREVVGLGRLELPTSRLSSARSNQLSYKPDEASCIAERFRPAARRKKEGKRGRRHGAILSNVEVGESS